MEAANLTVSINGDASDLLAAVSAANAGLENLRGTAESALAGIQDKTVTITARDNTAAGIASARAALNSLGDKTVTVTVNYRTAGKAYAAGTKNAAPGLALVNDEKGVADPRELICHDGRYIMYDGRDVLVPLDRGDRVYTAAQTKAVLSGRAIPKYASGVRNELFEAEKDDFTSLVKSSNVPIENQIAWWKAALEKYAHDSETVEECSEEIFALTRKLVDNINEVSDAYIGERTYFNDWADYGDSALEAFGRVKENNRKYLDEGVITYGEYCENLENAGKRLYEGRVEQSEKWLRQQTKYNGMSIDEYIEGLERMAAYTEEYFAQGIIDYREYTEGLESINNDIYDARAERGKILAAENAADYGRWEKDAEYWKKARDTYGDWSAYDDSPVKFYERCIDRVREFYEAGKIGWQQYMDDTFGYELELFKAQENAIDEAVKERKDYIEELKAKFKSQIDSLKKSWEKEDRGEEIADIREQMKIYGYAVTQRGQDKYEELKAQLKQLEREEEIARIEDKNNVIIERLEKELSIAEANKRGLLSSINARGLDTNDMVAGIVRETTGIQSFLSGMFSELIRAVKSTAYTNSYTDNSSRTYNIKTGAAAALSALTAAVGRNFAYRY